MCGNPLLGAFIGAILLHPNFVAMVNEGSAINFLGVPVRAVSYGSSVLPAFIAVYVMCHVEKFVAKHSPDIARVVLEPFITTVVMIPLTLCVFAPVGDYLGILLKVVLEWIYGTAGPLAPAIVGALIPFLVVTGTHLVLGPLAMMTLVSTGMEFVLMPVAILHNFVHGALDLGVAFKSKEKDTKSSAFSCAFTSLIAGISEPSLYGIALKNKAALIALIAGQFAGGLYFGITHTGIYTMPGAGLTFLSLAIYIGPSVANFINGCIATVVGMAVAFVVAFVLYKDEKVE
ncbi:MAG: PTS transporter subunit EIIC [Traorella sp.]